MANRLLQQVAAITAMYGQTVPAALYAALVGFYVNKFGNPSYYVLMLLSLYVPYSVVILVQEMSDAYFDRRFTTRVTYYFRVVVMQLVVAAVAIIWMFMPQSPRNVLGVGVCIGFLNGAISSSAKQMLAAMDANLTVYGPVGVQTAYLQPLLLFFVVDFNPYAPIWKFRLVISYSILGCVVVFSILSILHFRSDTFTKAYDRLAYDLDPEEDSFEQIAATRQYTETQPLCPEQSKHGVPSWVWTWCTIVGSLYMIKFCQMSLSASFGDTTLAQTLILIQFGAEFVGILTALPIPTISCFAKGPWHLVLAALTLSMVAFATLQLAKLGGVTVSDSIFLLSWAGLTGFFTFSNSFIELVVTAYVKVVDRKRISRRNRLIGCISLIFGLAAGLTILRLVGSKGVPTR